MPNLSIQGLSKAFKVNRILDDVSLECRQGEILGIFGRNGSGKSSLLKIIFGTLKADSIKLSINNQLIAPKKVIRRQLIAFLPQHSFLPQSMLVRKVIPMYLQDGESQNKVFYAPKISSIEKRKVGDLSAGELRYLELLLISNLEHPFILLDEPFAALEPLYKDLIKTLLINLKERKGIILTDHYYQDVLQVSTRNLLLKEGKFYDIRSKEDLHAQGYLSKNQLE